MREQASYLWALFCGGAVNGLGQLMMRWAGKDARAPFSIQNFWAWALDSRWWLLGLCLTWTSGLCWAILLKHVRLVFALPLFAGTAYVLSLLGAMAFLSERPTTLQSLGITCVFVGIFLIALKP